LYRKLIGRGLDHPSAVRFITSLCALGGAVIAISQLGNSLFMMLWVSATILFTGLAIMPFIRKIKENAEMPLKPSIWSTSVDNVSMDYALAKTRAAAQSGKGVSLVATVNALAVMEAEKNREYAAALRNSFLTLADGSGLVWALRFLNTPVQERVAGIDFMMRLARTAAAEGLPVYLLGAKEEAVKGAAEALKEQYPDLVIAGWRNGYFHSSDASVAEDIRKSGAKILFVAMGVPRQEIWIRENAPCLGDLVAVGVGGAFDVVSGMLRRAPRVWQKLGLEWFFRLLQEPWRWKRDIDLFLFVCRVFLTKIGLRPFREDRSSE
jgi:N-acetylglucosaminyldiphosphoundecaprenol N-acetyl-beta-D-mannosaminyltransferase